MIRRGQCVLRSDPMVTSEKVSAHSFFLAFAVRFESFLGESNVSDEV